MVLAQIDSEKSYLARPIITLCKIWHQHFRNIMCSASTFDVFASRPPPCAGIATRDRRSFDTSSINIHRRDVISVQPFGNDLNALRLSALFLHRSGNDISAFLARFDVAPDRYKKMRPYFNN